MSSPLTLPTRKLFLTSIPNYNLLRHFINKGIFRQRADTVKISINNIPEEGMTLRVVKEPGWFAKTLVEQDDPPACMEDIQARFDLKRLGDHVLIEGTVATALALTCSRCLERSLLPVDVRFRYTLAPRMDNREGEIELDTDDLEYGSYQDDTIDLEPLLFEQVFLQIPMKILCRRDCRGLCPGCGANLNVEPCRCGPREVDPRLAVLKHLSIKK